MITVIQMHWLKLFHRWVKLKLKELETSLKDLDVGLVQKLNGCVIQRLYYSLANLCDYITEDNGGLSEQGYTTSFDLTKQYPWPREELSKAEVQGFLNTARKVGSKFMHTRAEWLARGYNYDVKRLQVRCAELPMMAEIQGPSLNH